jgi:hypothetical protein
MAQFIVFRRDQNGTIERVDGLWDADDAAAAIRRMCAERGRADDGRWEAEPPEDQEHIMTWALDQEKRGRPKPS